MSIKDIVLQHKGRQPLSWTMEMGVEEVDAFLEQNISGPVAETMKSLEYAINHGSS